MSLKNTVVRWLPYLPGANELTGQNWTRTKPMCNSKGAARILEILSAIWMMSYDDKGENMSNFVVRPDAADGLAPEGRLCGSCSVQAVLIIHRFKLVHGFWLLYLAMTMKIAPSWHNRTGPDAYRIGPILAQFWLVMAFHLCHELFHCNEPRK